MTPVFHSVREIEARRFEDFERQTNRNLRQFCRTAVAGFKFAVLKTVEGNQSRTLAV